MRGSIERVLAALEAASVRYLIVGGVAVVLHGHLRTTADLDLVVQLTPDNVRRAIDALAALGFRSRLPVTAEHFADPGRRQEWIRAKGMTVFSLWDPARPGFAVDLFASEPFDFEDVYTRSVRLRLDSTDAVVLGLGDLLEMKRSTGRTRDLDDVIHLEELVRATDGQDT